MLAENFGIEIRAGGVDVVEHQRLELRTLAEQRCERAVAKHIRNLVKMPDGMQTLQRQVITVIARFACGCSPAEQSCAEGFADFLLLLVERLLWHFLPRETQVASCGNEP